jgi:hypothetical protein
MTTTIHAPFVTAADRTNYAAAPLTDIFNLMPGLVIELLGAPAIVTTVDRDSDHEIITFMVNTPQGDFELRGSWGSGQLVRVIGLAVDNQPDNIDLFEA